MRVSLSNLLLLYTTTALPVTYSFHVISNTLITKSPARRTHLQATVVETPSSPAQDAIKGMVLDQWKQGANAAQEYADMFGLSEQEAGFYGLVHAMRTSGMAYGLRSLPFIIKKQEISQIHDNLFDVFFNMDDLAKALEDDFLDAARGSTDNRKGWKVRIFVYSAGFLTLNLTHFYFYYTRLLPCPIPVVIPLKKLV